MKPEQREQQHPCDECGEMTDESELQHVDDPDEGEMRFLCEECRKVFDAEHAADDWKYDHLSEEDA